MDVTSLKHILEAFLLVLIVISLALGVFAVLKSRGLSRIITISFMGNIIIMAAMALACHLKNSYIMDAILVYIPLSYSCILIYSKIHNEK